MSRSSRASKEYEDRRLLEAAGLRPRDCDDIADELILGSSTIKDLSLSYEVSEKVICAAYRENRRKEGAL